MKKNMKQKDNQHIDPLERDEEMSKEATPEQEMSSGEVKEDKLTGEPEPANLPEQLVELQQKYDELNNSYLRLHAEFDNFRKRTLKEKADLTNLVTALRSGSAETAAGQYVPCGALSAEDFSFCFAENTEQAEKLYNKACASAGAPISATSRPSQRLKRCSTTLEKGSNVSTCPSAKRTKLTTSVSCSSTGAPRTLAASSRL